MTMEQIRYVKIPLAETRTEPDHHVEYALNVQGPVRSWTVWHRYNDFLTLAYELEREFPGTATPATLPPKTLSSWFAKVTAGDSSSNLEFIEERRHSLERYIQGMIMSDDDRWRTSKALQRFLAPAGKASKYLAGKNGPSSISGTASETGSIDSDAGWATAGSWLNDQRDAEQIIRDVRQSILRRENALTRNEVSVSHQCLLQAKRRLTDLGRTLKALEQGLEQISSGLAAGELLRRQDMLMRLNEEKANLTQLVLGPGVVSGGSDRAALLSGASTASNNTRLIGRAGGSTTAAGSGGSYNMPGAMPVRTHKLDEQGPPQPRSRRIFGNSNPPQETNETRGLDSQGLLQLQTERMREQDLVAVEFSALLRRQREMGETIGNELDLQNQLLNELDQDMDRTGNKLAAARRQTNKL